MVTQVVRQEDGWDDLEIVAEDIELNEVALR